MPYQNIPDRHLDQYPVPDDTIRIEMELRHPSVSPDVIPWRYYNPHADAPFSSGLPVWFPFYSDADWSTVFDVREEYTSSGLAIYLYAEHGHNDPWGEPIRLTSTATDFCDNDANRYAFFRGQYWAVVSPIFHHPERTSQLIRSDMTIEEVVGITGQNQPGMSLMDFLNRLWQSQKPAGTKIDWSKNGF